jgi:hypothetical protein
VDDLDDPGAALAEAIALHDLQADLGERAMVRARLQVELPVRMVVLLREGYTPEDVRARLGVTVGEYRVAVRLVRGRVAARDEQRP